MVSTLATRHRRGFTLIELLIVIVVIAILALIVIPKVATATARAKASAQEANVHAIQNACEIFNADTGLYPTNLSDVTATSWQFANGTVPNPSATSSTSGAPLTATSGYHGPYLPSIPNNPATGGNNDTTDYIYNNQTGLVTPGSPLY